MSRLKTEKEGADASYLSRRGFLQAGLGIAASFAAPAVLARPAASLERTLAFYNTHTGESLNTTYWADGDYVPGALAEINRVLRDHRSGEVYPMDTRLLDMLHVLRKELGKSGQFEIISGYRSPATNDMLRGKSNGVAKRSYHMKGQAIDIRLPGADLKQLRSAARSLKVGGVGYYGRSNFIHVDTGPVRSWG